MSRDRTSAKAVIRAQTHEPTTLKSGLTKIKRNLSQSIGINKDFSGQDISTAKMAPARAKTQSKQEHQNGNSDTGNQANGGPGRKAGQKPTASQSNENAHATALAEVIRKTSSQLQESQKATIDLLKACDTYAMEIEKFPVLLERFNNRSEQLKFKDNKILQHKHAIEVLNGINSEKEKEIKAANKANLEEAEKIQAEREEFEKQQKAAAEAFAAKEAKADKALKEKEAQLKQEADKKISRHEAELDKKFDIRLKALENDMDSQRKIQSEKAAKLEQANKEQLDKIHELEAKIESMDRALKLTESKHEDALNLMELYKSGKAELAKKLENLQKEFAVNNMPLDFYEDKFLKISNDIHSIASHYFGKDLGSRDIKAIRKGLTSADRAFFFVPLATIEPFVQLRVAHTQRVISRALHDIVWQDFSSEKTLAEPKFRRFLQEIEKEVSRSGNETHGSNRTARLWKALTVSAISSGSADTQSQGGAVQELVSSSHSRAEKVIERILLVLRPLLDEASLPHFKDDMFQLVTEAISVWYFAQIDEWMFTVNSSLDEQNKSDWTEYHPLEADDDHQLEMVPKPSDSKNVFTLFPIIIARKHISPQNASRGPPGSWPEQDEVLTVHRGLGLPEASEMVQMGKQQTEARKLFKQKFEESWELTESIRGHSRQNSISGETMPWPASPKPQWMSNGKTALSSELT